MSTIPRRRQASNPQAPEAEVAQLRSQLERLQADPSTISQVDQSHDLDARLKSGHYVRQYLLEDSDGRQPRNTFRHLNGFQAIIAVLKQLFNDCKNASVTKQEHAMMQDLVQACFSILTAAFHDHKGNQRYFQQRVDGGGWRSLTAILQDGLVIAGISDAPSLAGYIDRTFGCLLACALDDDSLISLFKTLERRLATHEEASGPHYSSETEISQTDADSEESKARNSQLTYEIVKNELGASAKVYNPDALLLMLEIWIHFQKESHGTQKFPPVACSNVPAILQFLAHISTSNLAALHSTGVLGVILPLLISSRALSAFNCAEIRNLASILLSLGVGTLDDAHLLYRAARSSSVAAELLLLSLKSSHIPFHVLFDLSLHGYASIELPGIGRPFPPQSASSGYTLSLWFQVVMFDPDSHTTIFGAFDASQTCFVLVYLEKDTHNLILQTSVTSSRPSVRFKSTSFKDNRWYHVAITHRRPKATSSSRASLFIDGEFVEQVKSHYPAAPTVTSAKNRAHGADSSTTKSNAVQMFLGTPQDLASRLGKDLVSTQWRLASACLFADVLSDDLLAVYYELGPRYSGNFQDCLGSFQTYQASAALNLRNESLHPGKEEKSDIVSAIRSKAGDLLPENRILLNISASIVLDDIDRNNIDETQLIKSLSRTATKNLRSVTRGGRNALAINGAIPAINEALLLSSGFAVLTGDPSVIVPQSLNDAAWRIAGCVSVGLSLLEAARKPEDILRSLDILFESILGSWRNSEAMERENGFGVLATILTSKLQQEGSQYEDPMNLPAKSKSEPKSEPGLAFKVLASVLKFVGYRTDKPEESVINNPLAYRILLVDLEIWRTSAKEVQKLYYEQFIIFASRSKYLVFNAKRLFRMRIVKKWLEALKSDIFTHETFGYFLETFKFLLTKNLSADTMRSLALYITYAVHKPKQQASTPARGKSIKLRTDLPYRRQTLSSPSPQLAKPRGDTDRQLNQIEVALRILEIYADILCVRDDVSNIKKFARTVTNKWLLHLLADGEHVVVLLTAKILARLLVISGPSYMQKFVEKTGGMAIMQYRLRRWWHVPQVWLICFAVFFGCDPGAIDFSRGFDLYSLLETFAPEGKATVMNPEILPVLTAMLQNGLMTVTRDQSDPDSPATTRSDESTPIIIRQSMPTKSQSMNLQLQTLPSTSSPPLASSELANSAVLLTTVTRFLADIHGKSQTFRDFTVASLYVQELFSVLFPTVVSSNAVSPETELHSRESALTFKGNDVIMRPLSANSSKQVPVVRTTTPDPPQALRPPKPQPPKRMSSYVLVTSQLAEATASPPKLQPVITPNKSKSLSNMSSSIVEELLELTIAVFSDQLFSRKDFPGLGLFMRVPPGFQEHQAYFETFILRNTLSHFGNSVKLNQQLLSEPRVLTNLARFASHLAEAIYEGWFIDGADDTLEFLAHILEYLQIPSVSSSKTVRLCSQIISSIRAVLLRVLLLRLSELDDSASSADTVAFLNKLAYWQTVLWPVQDYQDDFLRLFCYLLYNRLISPHEKVRMAAANLWRMLLVQKPDDIPLILQDKGTHDPDVLIRGFRKIVELDNETFLEWMDTHREALDEVLFIRLSKAWETFVTEENRKTEETGKARIGKRREKLRLWVSDQAKNAEIVRRHETTTEHWRSNIYAAENLKRQRTLQDQQDSQIFNITTWSKMNDQLRRPCGVLDDLAAQKWQLDQTEGPNRMRMRFVPDKNTDSQHYQPKRSQSQGRAKHRRSTGVRSKPSMRNIPAVPTQSLAVGMTSDALASGSTAASRPSDGNIDQGLLEEDFEIVDDPRDEGEDYEDKNRKVMRSLQRGDQVEHVHNVSRIVGLDAVESLLILGKAYLYLLDNLFQRSDGEIVNVWQAPPEERDPYLQMISGRDAGEAETSSWKKDYETRSWRWEDVRSISKRRFLFRDVAMEIFFIDGRSYLLTMSNVILRNELYQRLLSRVSSVTGRTDPSNGEDTWRIQSVQNPDDETQSLGSRFTSVFAQSSQNPATRKWMKGEISNFHYLMLVNTMAGRTFNDLTQYPVFPWVLADYQSDELDLTDPRSFRDLTKPMGCQTFERQTEFKERYRSFAEMGDHNAPPFHYGTHYSSAMIVTSYLIRLQPFVHSYLLLQGGSFDHPDRLFYSIEKAWASASKENMTDVRELIPEFYYLPEFLLNTNGYDFGERQGDGGKIDTVVLPPWAKGDPKIFIAKHREALESDYVSQHLHAWIDLVFGHKQRGEASLEATNVFHHLSYHGAKDLDTIDDPVERLATIGIIHNFGQTPHQVFQRTHPIREDAKHKVNKLDSVAENLTRLPFPFLESPDRVFSLQYSLKHDRVLSAGPFKLNIGPTYDRYMEWGFFDGSVRFFASDNRKLLGLFEHVHQGQISTAVLADSQNLVTAGTDSTVSVWTIISTSKAVDLQPRKTLFGHRSSVTALAVSKPFSTLLSAALDGKVILWDLNRLELVRVLTSGPPVECAQINNVTGTIMLCRGSEVSIWTLNGSKMLEQNVLVEGDDIISSCAFYEGSGSEFLKRNLIFTGHKRGVVNVWNIAIRDGAFVLDHVKRMHHMDQAGFNIGASITAILPMAQVVYTGDDDGRVYEWDCIQRQ